MKYLVPLMLLVQQRRDRRNLLVLLRFVAVLTGMVVLYSILFHLIMEFEGQSYSWVTGLYWTLTVMTTLGFGDITFESDLGRLFSLLVLGSGVVFLLVLFPFTLIRFFYAPWIEAQAAARTPRQLPPETSEHVILTHYDPVTEALIRKIEQFGHTYAVIVPKLEEARRLSDLGVRVLVGEPDDPETHRRARVDRAGMVATTLTDAQNANVAFTVRQVTDRTPVVATATDDSAETILNLAGATGVLQLGPLMGHSLARCTVGGDAVTHVIGQFDEVLIAEANAAKTPLVGKTLRENRISDLGVTVIGVWSRGQFQHATPDTVVGPTTILMLVGSAEQLQSYDEQFAIYNVSAEPVVILGGGRIGTATARALDERNIDWRMVELNPGNVRDKARTVAGNAADQSVLEAAGLMKAPAVLITTHDDNINLYLTLLCRQLRPDVQIICRATLDRNVATLHRAGADFVLSYASLSANAIFNSLKQRRVLTLAEGLEVYRVKVPASLHKVTLMESGIRERTGSSVVACSAPQSTEPGPEPTPVTQPPSGQAAAEVVSPPTPAPSPATPTAAPAAPAALPVQADMAAAAAETRDTAQRSVESAVESVRAAAGSSEGPLIINPPATTRLYLGGDLVLVGTEESREKFLKEFGSE